MNAQRDDAVSAFCNFVVGLKDEDVPAQTRANVHKFVLDSFGVGIAGSCGPHVEALISTFCANSGIGTTRIWGDRRTLSTAAAATCLAYQIHNSEFDCVHEEAVVHPMAVVLGAMVSICDRLQAEGKPVHGRSFTTAVCAAVDVAAETITAASASALALAIADLPRCSSVFLSIHEPIRPLTGPISA
mgnify:CR=1 FL=1